MDFFRKVNDGGKDTADEFSIHLMILNSTICNFVIVFKAFGGQGNRLDGKSKPSHGSSATVDPQEIKRLALILRFCFCVMFLFRANYYFNCLCCSLT